MVVVLLTYWPSFEYVRHLRHAMQPKNAKSARIRGAHHVLSLLIPCLEPAQKSHLQSQEVTCKSPENLSA
jgi:hypothetical protein